MSLPAVVLFDLDGTLSDSAPGILAALRHALSVHGVPPLDAATERALLGPPFYESLPPLLSDPALLPSVIAAYRERYGAGGMFDTAPYPGVSELVADLAARGVRLAVATSKPQPYAEPILDHLGLLPYFETVGGDRLDGSLGSKALVIEEVLCRLGQPDVASVVMVGDREHDVLGAREHGIDTLGVAWGYAAPGELSAAGALAVCADAGELARRLASFGS